MKYLGDIKETLITWYKEMEVFTKKVDTIDNSGTDSITAIVYSEIEAGTFNILQNEYLGIIDGMEDIKYLSYTQILTRCLEIQNLIHFNLVKNTDRDIIVALEEDYAFVHNLMIKTIKYFTAK
jgi:predicted RNA-binding protein (virulence factor B family)